MCSITQSLFEVMHHGVGKHKRSCCCIVGKAEKVENRLSVGEMGLCKWEEEWEV